MISLRQLDGVRVFRSIQGSRPQLTPLLVPRRSGLVRPEWGTLKAMPFEIHEPPDCSFEGSDNAECRWDSQKESRRANSKRTVFGFDDWKRHRSNDRFWKNMKNMLFSGVMRGIKGPMLAVMGFTALVALYNHVHLLGNLPSWIPAPPIVSYQTLGVTSFALSLLLVFRTNASYARWWTARSAFSSIIKQGCNIARQAFFWFQREDILRKELLHRWLITFAKTCHLHLTTNDASEWRRVIGDTLAPYEMDMLLRAPHKPSYCLQMISEIVHSAGLSDVMTTKMDESISLASSAVSECEGILYHPIPLSYSRHTSRFLMAWMASLPFALWQTSGWSMVPVMALVSFVLLGIEEIGVYIEEPFSILPLEFLSHKLEVIVGGMFKDHLDVKDQVANAISPLPGRTVATASNIMPTSSNVIGSVV